MATSSPAQSLDTTFRDPAGFLVIKENRVLRTVRKEFVSNTLAFLESPIARKWVDSQRLVSTEVLEAKAGEEAHLEHGRVFFPSYPWEWTPGQLSAAAELTLDFCEDLVDSGWVLKDATPRNVLFDGPFPRFVDVLSIERRDPLNPLWLASGQFVRTFLLPLAAHKYLGWPLSATLTQRDGYEPADLYPKLGLTRRIRRPLLSLVTLPVLFEAQSKTLGAVRIRRPPPIATAVLKHTLRSLRRSLQRLRPSPLQSRWNRYVETASHYSQDDSNRKTAFVRDSFMLTRAKDVLDVGGNTGIFSRLAAFTGARVVSWDADVAATEQAWDQARQVRANVVPLVANFARPTPATGWNNSETLSLIDRARGRFDFVAMLAVLHHLLVSDQIPLDRMAPLIRELTSRWLLIEWVSPSDPMFRKLSCGRDELYAHLTHHAFLSAFTPYFRMARHMELGNGRIVHLFEAR
jgi:SAM-dependent methyltransferase